MMQTSNPIAVTAKYIQRPSQLDECGAKMMTACGTSGTWPLMRQPPSRSRLRASPRSQAWVRARGARGGKGGIAPGMESCTGVSVVAMESAKSDRVDEDTHRLPSLLADGGGHVSMRSSRGPTMRASRRKSPAEAGLLSQLTGQR